MCHCGKPVYARELCRRHYNIWRRANHPEGRTCEFDDRAEWAIGLCWKHYSLWHRAGYVIGPPKPRGRPAKPETCKRCGGTFKRRKSPDTERQRTLCRTCIWIRECRKCSQEFDAAGTNYFYCEACRFDDFADYWQYWADNNPEQVTENAARRRARKRNNGRVERFWRKTIYQRDNWTCGICGHPVDPDLEWPNPESASLDHIVPLSQGGEHTRANTRLAHLHCNTSRGAGPDDDPLQLAIL